jgi:hypothetical protein
MQIDQDIFNNGPYLNNLSYKLLYPYVWIIRKDIGNRKTSKEV